MTAKDWFRVAGVCGGWSLYMGLVHPEVARLAWESHFTVAISSLITAGLVAACDWVGARWTVVRRDRPRARP